VPQVGHQRPRVHARGDAHRREGVAALVETERLESFGLPRPMGPVAQGHVGEGTLLGSPEDQPLASSGPQQVLGQVRAEFLRDRHAAAAASALGLDYALLDVPRALDLDPPPFAVDVRDP